MPIDDFPTTTALPHLNDCANHAHAALRSAREAAHSLEGARATRVAELVEKPCTSPQAQAGKPAGALTPQ